MSAGKQGFPSKHKPLMRPVVGLVENLPKKDLENLTVEAIRKHRLLRDEAEALEASYSERQPNSADTIGPSRIAWVSAMIQMHTQQAVLSTLLDVLGYIPDVPAEKIGGRARLA